MASPSTPQGAVHKITVVKERPGPCLSSKQGDKGGRRPGVPRRSEPSPLSRACQGGEDKDKATKRAAGLVFLVSSRVAQPHRGVSPKNCPSVYRGFATRNKELGKAVLSGNGHKGLREGEIKSSKKVHFSRGGRKRKG